VASHPARPVAPSKHDFGLDIGEDARGGVVIRNIDPSSNAADVLEQGDAIVEVNGAIVKSARDAADRIKATPQGRPVLLKVRRDDTSRYVALERR
jgi:S1-C subfamily serine protease